jgi:hypothetical protein
MRGRLPWLPALCLAAWCVAEVNTQIVLAPLNAMSAITYFIEEGTAASAYRPGDRQLAVWALEAWARHSRGMLRFEPADARDATIRVNWVPASDGRYGEMVPTTVNGRRGATVYIRPDTDFLGPAIASIAREDSLLRDTIVYLTCLHELGHALGLPHTSAHADIMYFFGYGGDIPGFFGRYREQLSERDDIATVSGLSPNDVSRIQALYPAAPR